jgi:excisionase family DNA binding protein
MTLDELIASGRATCTIEEVAELLEVGRGTAYQAARVGQLPVMRLGRRLLVSVPRLLQLLEGQ